MNGRELVEQVIALSPSTEILLISGYPDNHISIDGQLNKDYAFMQKPFSVNEFGQKVRDVLSNKKSKS
jgi:DNA-binding NtrC family response regulator